MDFSRTSFVVWQHILSYTMPTCAKRNRKKILSRQLGLWLLCCLLPGVFLYAGEPSTPTPDQTKPEESLTATTPKIYTAWPFSEEEARRRQLDTAKALGVPVEKTILLPGDVPMTFVLIPAGTFVMGSPDDEPGRIPKRGETAHTVQITKPFYIAKYECTQKQWLAVAGYNLSKFKEVGPDAPVDMMYWHAIYNNFINKLQSLAPKGFAFDLPTEAQWEYSCRAGTDTAFSFGDTLTKEQANIDNPEQKSKPVGSYAANAWGLYDMHGNVWEWCRDTFHKDAYEKLPQADPHETRSSPRYVLRGGSWRVPAIHCRSAIRGRSTPSRPYIYFGFRLILRFDEKK